MFDNPESVAFWSALAGGSIAAVTSIFTLLISRIFDEKRERRKLAFEIAAQEYERISRAAQAEAEATRRTVWVRSYDEFVIYADHMVRIMDGRALSKRRLRKRMKLAKDFMDVKESIDRERNKEQDRNSKNPPTPNESLPPTT